MIYQWIKRRDEHFSRISQVFDSALKCTEEIANQKGINVYAEIDDIKLKLERNQSLLKPKGAELWLLISIVTFGLGTLYVSYFLTKDWALLQNLEQEILDGLTRVWMKLGVTSYPVTVQKFVPDRSFFLYILLSLVTCGLWKIYWAYCIHTDPEKVFMESEVWENVLLQSLGQIQ